MNLDLLTPALQQLATAFFFQALQSPYLGLEDKFVNGLDEIFVQLRALLLLSRPLISVRLGIGAMDIVVISDQSINGIPCELKGDFVAMNHVYMDNVGFHVEDLMAAEDASGQLCGRISLDTTRQHK